MTGVVTQPTYLRNGEEMMLAKDELKEKASSWGVEGDAWKGMATSQIGEVKTGGLGGVLKWGIGLPVFTPLAAAEW